jgi:hypothetical protein
MLYHHHSQRRALSVLKQNGFVLLVLVCCLYVSYSVHAGVPQVLEWGEGLEPGFPAGDAAGQFKYHARVQLLHAFEVGGWEAQLYLRPVST